MSGQWYFSRNGQQFGPVSFEQLQQFATSNQLQRTDLVWTDGMAQWSAAETVNGLFPPLAEGSRPPLPPNMPQTNTSWNEGKILVISGYVCSGVSLIFCPPAFGLAGVICGIMNLVRGRTIHGLAQVILAAVCAIIGMIVGAALATS